MTRVIYITYIFAQVSTFTKNPSFQCEAIVFGVLLLRKKWKLFYMHKCGVGSNIYDKVINIYIVGRGL